MASKYDTNPLDPEFPEKAKAAAASGAKTSVLPENRFATAEFPTSFDAVEWSVAADGMRIEISGRIDDRR